MVGHLRNGVADLQSVRVISGVVALGGFGTVRVEQGINFAGFVIGFEEWSLEWQGFTRQALRKEVLWEARALDQVRCLDKQLVR